MAHDNPDWQETVGGPGDRLFQASAIGAAERKRLDEEQQVTAPRRAEELAQKYQQAAEWRQEQQVRHLL